MTFDYTKSQDVGEDGLSFEEEKHFVTAGDDSPVGNAAPLWSRYYRTNGEFWVKTGVGDNDWEIIREGLLSKAINVSAEDPNSIGSDNVQGQLDELGNLVFNPTERDLITLQVILDNDGLAISNTTFQTIPFNSIDIENDDTTIDLDTSNNEDIRIKEDGLYLVSYNVNYEQPNDNRPDSIDWRVTKNGTSIRISERRFKVEHDDLWNQTGHSFLLQASANDVLNFQVQNNDNKSYTLYNPLVFNVIKMSNATGPSSSTGGSQSRSDLAQGGVAELIHTVSQNLSGTSIVTINWGSSEVIDTNHYSFSGNEITLNIAGRYKVISKMNFDLTGGARTRVKNLWQNATSSSGFSDLTRSSSYCYMRANNASDDGTCLSMFTVTCAVGDRLRLTAQNSANNSATIADESNVYLEFLGA